MASAATIWGIDIGRCALKALKLRSGPEGLVEVLAHDYIEHPKILSQPDANRNELIASALETFLSRNDLSKDQVVVSVPGQHTLARFTKLPPVAPKRIPDIIRYEADQQIPFDMDEVIWDYQIFEQEGMPDIEAGIFAMKRELLREHLLHFEQASISPVAVQSSPLAVYNAARFDGLLGEQTTILVDVGAENTDLVVATPHNLWTRTIPIGGNACTDALVKSFKLSFSKAESLKRSAETSKYRRQIFQAMRPVFADLVQELQRSIGFYSSTHREAEFQKMVGVGNAFLLPGLKKYLQQNLGMTVETPASFAKVVANDAANAATLAENRLSFFVAYGLALQGLDQAKVASNLLPTEIAKQLVWRKKRPAFAAAAACLVIAGGLIWFRQTADMSALAAGAEAARGVDIPEGEAWNIIQEDARPYPQPRARATAIHMAGKELKAELGKLSNEGKDERAESEAVIALQRNKAIVPKVLQLIHESVPRPDGAVGQAQTGDEFAAAVRQAGLPRAQRRLVTVESIDMVFEPDLNVYKWESLVEVEPPINDSASEVAGIQVKIVCLTPNAGGTRFISEAFLDALRKNGRRPGAGFYFDRVYLIDGWKVSAAPGATGARPAVRAPTPGASVRQLDPLTDESIDDDYQFEVWLDVILENLPEPEETETEPPEEGGD